MGGRQDRNVSVVEAAYAPIASEREWLENLLRAAAPVIDEGLGTAAYVYDASTAPLRVDTLVEVGVPFPTEILLGALGGVDDEYIANTWRRLSFGLGSQLVPFSELPAARGLVEVGVH